MRILAISLDLDDTLWPVEPAILAARAKAAVDAGADGVNFYNYGLIPAKRLDWVQAAVDAINP